MSESEIVSHAERERERETRWERVSCRFDGEWEGRAGGGGEGKGSMGMLMQSTNKCRDEALSVTDEDVW